MWDCGKRSHACVEALGGGGGSAARVLSVFILINKGLSGLTESRSVWQEIRSNFIQVIGLQNPQNFPQEEPRETGQISSSSRQNTCAEEGIETKGKRPPRKGAFCLSGILVSWGSLGG